MLNVAKTLSLSHCKWNEGLVSSSLSLFWCSSLNLCVGTGVLGYVCVRACVIACYKTETVTMLNLTSVIYSFYTWLLVKFCRFVNALYESNVTKTNSGVYLNVNGE